MVMGEFWAGDGPEFGGQLGKTEERSGELVKRTICFAFSVSSGLNGRMKAMLTVGKLKYCFLTGVSRYKRDGRSELPRFNAFVALETIPSSVPAYKQAPSDSNISNLSRTHSLPLALTRLLPEGESYTSMSYS